MAKGGAQTQKKWGPKGCGPEGWPRRAAWDRPSVPPQEIEQPPQKGCRESRHRWPHSERKTPRRCQICKLLDKAKTKPQCRLWTTKSKPEDFIERAKKRLLQHRCHQRGTGGVAESGIHKESRGQEFGRGGKTSPTPQTGPKGPSSSSFRPGIGTLGGAVTVGARWFGKSIEEPKFHEIGGDGSPCAEFRGSHTTRVGTIRQTASSWRRHSDKPAGSRMLDGLEAIGVARCSRDGRHFDHQVVVPVDFQGSAPDGVFPFHGFPSMGSRMVLKQVLPLHRALWGWRGVRVGEVSNPGPVQTRSARRLAEPLQGTVQDSVKGCVGGAGVCEHCLGLGNPGYEVAEVMSNHTRGWTFGRSGSCPLQPWQACGPQDRWRIACDGSCKSRSSFRSRILARGRKSEGCLFCSRGRGRRVGVRFGC